MLYLPSNNQQVLQSHLLGLSILYYLFETKRREHLLDIQCYEWKFKDWSDQRGNDNSSLGANTQQDFSLFLINWKC